MGEAVKRAAAADEEATKAGASAKEDEIDLATEALEAGLKLLRPGGRLVMYGQHLQPMAAKQGAMRADGGFVEVRLHQLFTREYQVLPQRTHPIMTADAQIYED